MPGVFFTNALMLGGMAALAVPVLIHLLLKRKKKRLRFSTIQFFLKQDEQSSRRRKLRNWLLLALRLFLVALLVAAFARPYLRRGGASVNNLQKQRVVFVLDRSASMLATGIDGQRWAQAKERIKKVMSSLSVDDRAALVQCSTHADVVSSFAPPQNISKALASLEPGYGTSNLGDGLRQALKLLSSGDRNTRETICIVSDLQRTACRGVATCPVPQEVEVKVLTVGDLHSPNIAITGFEVEPHDGHRPQMALTSFSDEDSPNLAFGISVDGKEVFSRIIDLKAGASTNAEVLLPALKPGWHEASAFIRSKDSLALDDARYAALFVPEPARVFVVETRPTKRVFEQESFFLTSALDPSLGTTNSVPGAFNLVQMSPEELVGKISGAGEQMACDVVILPGLKDLPLGAAGALREFVRAGGGLLLFVNDQINVSRYNVDLRELLPAQLGKIEATPESGAGWRVGEHDTNTPAFSAFRLPNSGNLNIPEFTKRFSLTEAEGASRLALFDDEAPLLLARAVGKGQVVLVNTSADTAWSDWPKHKTFVPWLHRLGKYLTHKTDAEANQWTNNFVADEELELGTASSAAVRKSQLKLNAPGGNHVLVSCDDQGRLRDAVLKSPGIYSLRDNSGHELRRIAVNLPAQESDLEAMPAVDFQQQITRTEEPPRQTLTASLFGSQETEKELCTLLLGGAVLLLLLEPLLANRTTV